MSDGAHLLIPFAACAAPGCLEASQQLRLPQLTRLLQRLPAAATDAGDERSLTPPHERILAREYRLAAPDGCIPWAAWQMQQEQPQRTGVGASAWAWITPCHWHVASDHIVMKHPLKLQLDGEDSQSLLAAMQPFFAQDVIALEYHSPTRWLACGELFSGLATASLDRVLGRDIEQWVPRAAVAGPLRRLQQEMQMLLYTHPVNDQRVRRGLLPVNSFWASGTGALPAGYRPAPPASILLPDALRDAALLRDWAAWSDGWQQIDSVECRQLNDRLDRGDAVTLTLCGEANARSWSGPETAWWQRLRAKAVRRPLSNLLEAL